MHQVFIFFHYSDVGRSFVGVDNIGVDRRFVGVDNICVDRRCVGVDDIGVDRRFVDEDNVVGVGGGPKVKPWDLLLGCLLSWKH